MDRRTFLKAAGLGAAAVALPARAAEGDGARKRFQAALDLLK